MTPTLPALDPERSSIRLAEPNKKDALLRCDREIERCIMEARNGNPDVEGILQGLHDWRYEKILIEQEPDTLADPAPVWYGESERAAK